MTSDMTAMPVPPPATGSSSSKIGDGGNDDFDSKRVTSFGSTATTTTTASSSTTSLSSAASFVDDEEKKADEHGDEQHASLNYSLVDIIVSEEDEQLRNTSLDEFVKHATIEDLLKQCQLLDEFRRTNSNLYYKVRALFFLYSIYRYHIPSKVRKSTSTTTTNGMGEVEAVVVDTVGEIPFHGYQQLMERHFDKAIDIFLQEQATYAAAVNSKKRGGGVTNEAVISALATSYYQLGFQTLANQVKISVKNFPSNTWMFDLQDSKVDNSHPLRIRDELLSNSQDSHHKVLCEKTPVRMDLSHSGWSDIFFLAMDYPEGARVLNISVDLAVQGKHSEPQPPITSYLMVMDNEPGIIKLTSIDLKSSVTLTTLDDVFDFAKDYLGLLRAGIIASGIIPPCYEPTSSNNNNNNNKVTLKDILDEVIGLNKGLHLITHVNDIPKGSRLAVSTNLLGSIISICMRATKQTTNLIGKLTENERRVVASRAILGEWLGGSGGGWQDSGGIWPGIKLITGVKATTNTINNNNEGNNEESTTTATATTSSSSASRGCLLPNHHQLTQDEAPSSLRQQLQDSLILVHGGMAQNVGPILEMVTEKYLLRERKEWLARQDALNILDEILVSFQTSNIQKLAQLTTDNFFNPLQTIIPWSTNLYTETIIERVKAKFSKNDEFWGFWMLGGMSGGGMGFMFHPSVKQVAMKELHEIMLQTKHEMQHSLPFAMDPVVYDFAINEYGTKASWYIPQTAAADDDGSTGNTNIDHLLRQLNVIPTMAKKDASNDNDNTELTEPTMATEGGQKHKEQQVSPRERLDDLLKELGCNDMEDHKQVQKDLQCGKIGLEQNRLPSDCCLTNAIAEEDVIQTETAITDDMISIGRQALQQGTVGVVTLAAGVGSRWTQGAGCVKAIHPFCKLGGKHRTFLEVHIAKSRRVSQEIQQLSSGNESGDDATADATAATAIPHVFTTSYLTDGPLQEYLNRVENHNYQGKIYQSRGTSIGVRLIPTERDLKFQWEERQQQKLDQQAQKVRESLQCALLDWAKSSGEGSDYCDNVPHQCLHPVGHWYEIPNLLLNGTLYSMLKEQPQLQTLMLHNIDTLGADVNAGLLGLFLSDEQSTLAFEVVPRQIADQGGGLARVNGVPRLVEGLALPRGEEDEFKLSYYNSMTTWIDIDKLLKTFGLTRQDLSDTAKVHHAVHQLSNRLPTYITLKDVKKRWGNAQEDILPVAQYEKLWSDMSALDDVNCQFFVVPRLRGQQLKDPSQLDGWFRDGSAEYVEQICSW